MAQCPAKESILKTTGDSFKSAHLERMLTNLTTSYKVYWLKGVFEEAVQGTSRVSFRKIVARMVAEAWYPVVYFRLSLGASDQIAGCIDHLRKDYSLPSDLSQDEIIDVIMNATDRETIKRINNFQNYVPYRIIRPFYEYALIKIKEERGKLPDSSIDAVILNLNQQRVNGAPYTFIPGEKAIDIQPEWIKYFQDNKLVIRGWLDMKLIEYLQARNPSVPAIPLKLRAPQKRNLIAAQRYWHQIIEDHEVTEIYTGLLLNEDNYEVLGPLSIDHFVPWSFVLHDEPWNLAPMFRNINSSKNDGLPPLDSLLQPFCAQQFDALMTVRKLGGHKKIMESYLTIDARILEYDRTEASLEHFSKTLQNTIIPLHQIALNQGFPLWIPPKMKMSS